MTEAWVQGDPSRAPSRAAEHRRAFAGRLASLALVLSISPACGSTNDEEGEAGGEPTPPMPSCASSTVTVDCAERVAAMLAQTESDRLEWARHMAALSEALDARVEQQPAKSPRRFARCIDAREGSSVVCVPRFTPTTICPPFPTSEADLVGLGFKSPAMRDLYTLGTENADEATLGIAKSRLCDLLRRQEENEARHGYAEELDLSSSQLAEFDEDLADDWRTYGEQWAPQVNLTDQQRAELVERVQPWADQRAEAQRAEARRMAAVVRALRGVF